MAIYKLPTRSSRKYRGKYPTRVRSFAYAKGTAHFELNDGRRYVANGWELDDRASITGNRFDWAFKPDVRTGRYYEGIADSAPVMSLGDYAAIVFIGRLLRLLKRSPRLERINAKRAAGNDGLAHLFPPFVSDFDVDYPNSNWCAYLTDSIIIPEMRSTVAREIFPNPLA